MLLEYARTWQVTKAHGFVTLALVAVILLKDACLTFNPIVHVYQSVRVMLCCTEFDLM